jgi:abortive infection bacteriophage resistance protein
MTQLSDEDLRDETLNLFEEKEEELLAHEEAIKTIEQEALDTFDKRAIAIKNRLVQDITVSDDELAGRYDEEIQKMGEELKKETEEKVNVYVRTLQASKA